MVLIFIVTDSSIRLHTAHDCTRTILTPLFAYYQWILPRSYHGLITWGQLQLLCITRTDPHFTPWTSSGWAEPDTGSAVPTNHLQCYILHMNTQ